jgi:glycosyltransferase involved in cell wall biosynthesis
VWNQQSLSVVLPAYNEEPNIARAVEGFRALGIVDEIVVVDNNSRDRTAELARAAGARVVNEARQGYGFALRRGLAEATGDLVALCEPDGTFLPRDLHKLLAYSEDFDLVMGTRTTRELLWQEANMGWFLRVGNVVVAKLMEVLHQGPSLSDCGCTFRLINRRGRDLILPGLTVGASHFLPDMTIQALRKGLRVIEIPLNYLGRVGESKITGSLKGAVRTGLRMIGLIVAKRFAR